MNRVEEVDPNSSSPESKVRTPAYASFDSNTDKLLCVFGLVSRSVQHFSDEIKTSKVSSEIANLVNLQNKEASEQETEKRAQYANQVQVILNNFVKAIEEFTNGFLVMRQWIPVMLVTIVEAYLKEVLIYAAKTDPTIMESSEQSASYSEVRKAQSLEELKEELQSRWARNFVDDGGPDRWIKRLTKMGARGYSSQAAGEMETLWGVRHVIVHSAGIGNLEFARRHPEFRAKAGESIRITSGLLNTWITEVYHFVDVTDFYFAQRCGLATVLST